jgi:NADPH:quinone reductase-like Zn-dependent oxidoreductase
MKAVVCTQCGPPNVLRLKEVATPVPKGNEVLTRTYATTVTIEDVAMRCSTGPDSLGRQKETILGAILAGEIEAVGKAVRRFRTSDQVYGFTGFFRGLGTYAEYVWPKTGVWQPNPPI